MINKFLTLSITLLCFTALQADWTCKNLTDKIKNDKNGIAANFSWKNQADAEKACGKGNSQEKQTATQSTPLWSRLV